MQNITNYENCSLKSKHISPKPFEDEQLENTFGGMHKDRDIVIFIPEEGLVVVGDVALNG